MAMRVCKLVVLAASAFTVADAQYTKNPVQAVVNLMEKLKAKIIKEGKTEAVAYDKFACFCKDNADEKLYSITKKTARINELAASIKKLTAEIADATAQMEKAEKRKTELEKESKAAAEQDASDHKDFLKERDDRKSGIVALTKAIKFIKGTKDDVASAMLEVKVSGEQTELVREAMRILQKEDPKAYAFKGGESLKTLVDMKVTFIRDLNSMEEYESERKHAVNMEEGARRNEIMALSNKITKCQTLIGEKSTQKSEDENEKSNLEGDRADDQDFMDTLTSECEDKAEKWDTRSSRRVTELRAMSEALGILKGDGVGKSGSLKLNGLLAKGRKVALSFVQSASAGEISFEEAQTRKQAVAFVMRAANKLGSSSLFNLVMRMRDSPFDSVKSMIEDLITKIDDEQSNEEEEIEACKTDITSNTQARADNKAKIEEEEATIVSKGRAVKMHSANANDLAVDISALYKSLNEATELRKAEKEENEFTISEAKAGEAALIKAMDVLKEFYDTKMELVQTRVAEVGPQPEMMGGDDFLGGDASNPSDPSKGDDAKGIMGLLGTIKQDYSDTISEVGEDEEAAEDAYNKFKTKTEDDIASKESDKNAQKRKKRESQDDIEQASFDLESWKQGKAQAEYELSILTPRCLGLGASQKQRKERREQEKAALQEAITILSAMAPADTKNTFLQKHA